VRVPRWLMMAMFGGFCISIMRGQIASTTLQQTASTSSSTASGETTQDPVKLEGGMKPGTIVRKVQPSYPEEARRARIGGTVVLHAIIAKDGTIKNLSIVSGPELLQEAAAEAVKQWVYEPYLVNGQPSEVDTLIRVNFSLNHPRPTLPNRVPVSAMPN